MRMMEGEFTDLHTEACKLCDVDKDDDTETPALGVALVGALPPNWASDAFFNPPLPRRVQTLAVDGAPIHPSIAPADGVLDGSDAESQVPRTGDSRVGVSQGDSRVGSPKETRVGSS